MFAVRPGTPSSVRSLALIFIGVGVWLIVTSMHDRTETVTARVSASHLAFSRAENVHFKFADGSEDDGVSPSADGFFDAVTKFGPDEPARVTRNAANNSIYKVEFHGKTYTLNSPGGNLGGEIIAVVLGLLGLAYVVLASRGRRGAATGELSQPSPARTDAP